VGCGSEPGATQTVAGRPKRASARSSPGRSLCRGCEHVTGRRGTVAVAMREKRAETLFVWSVNHRLPSRPAANLGDETALSVSQYRMGHVGLLHA
jgi:hypothetical protein